MANFEDDMDKPVTKRELLEVLDIWGGAFRADLRAEWRADILEMGGQLRTEMHHMGRQVTATLSAELAQHTNRILEETRKLVGVVDEKYNDLPQRVEILEAKAFPPKRQRRR